MDQPKDPTTQATQFLDNFLTLANNLEGMATVCSGLATTAEEFREKATSDPSGLAFGFDTLLDSKFFKRHAQEYRDEARRIRKELRSLLMRTGTTNHA